MTLKLYNGPSSIETQAYAAGWKKSLVIYGDAAEHNPVAQKPDHVVLDDESRLNSMKFRRSKYDDAEYRAEAEKSAKHYVQAMEQVRSMYPDSKIGLYDCCCVHYWQRDNDGTGTIGIGNMDDAGMGLLAQWNQDIWGPVVEKCDIVTPSIYAPYGQDHDAAYASIEIWGCKQVASNRLIAPFVWPRLVKPTRNLTMEEWLRYQILPVKHAEVGIFVWDVFANYITLACSTTRNPMSSQHLVQAKWREIIGAEYFDACLLLRPADDDAWANAEADVQSFWAGRHLAYMSMAEGAI